MNKATGAIVGSSLVSLYDGIGRQDREDILDCLSHAHAFASRYHDQRDDYSNWMFRYRTRLENRGCILVNPILHTPQVIVQASELDAVTFDIIDSAGSRALADLAGASWHSLKVSGHAKRFFRNGSRDGELGRFQMVPCVSDANGDVLLLICAIRLTESVDTRDFDFWTDTRREMLLRISGGVYRFDRAVYAGYRALIRTQLNSNADRAIEQFPI